MFTAHQKVSDLTKVGDLVSNVISLQSVRLRYTQYTALMYRGDACHARAIVNVCVVHGALQLCRHGLCAEYLRVEGQQSFHCWDVNTR